MLGIVLGNGPSKQLYDRTGDFVIGCNIPGEDFSVDATVICDEEIAWILKDNTELIGDLPLIISTKVFEKFKEFKIVNKFNIVNVFTPKEWYNSAHYAAEYLMELGCEEIHLWGCDSIFEDSTASSTYGNSTGGDPRFYRNWRRVWNTIYLSSNIEIVAMKLPK